MKAVTCHGTPYSPLDSLGNDIFVPHPQTRELWGEAQAMETPSLCSSEDLDYTMTNPNIPAPTKVYRKPQYMPLLILTPPSTPKIMSQYQQIVGYTKKTYAPHCLSLVTPTGPSEMTYPTIQMMAHHIQYHKQLMWLIL